MPINIATAFYDAMFGTTDSAHSMSEVEKTALANVREILNSPKLLSKNIPPLPTVLMRLLESLKDPGSDFFDIAEIIEQDPGLATEVLRVSNSCHIHRGEGEICSLRKAVSLLGVAGVSSIAATIMVEKIRPAKPIYYKMFGRQIWLHSLHCAYLCKLLALKYDENEFDAYFLGLIHDIGKIIIFNCLCEAFRSEFPDGTPGSRIYKELMSEMSLDITSFIAREWQLPSVYCLALEQLRGKRESKLSQILYRANVISEAYILLDKNLVTSHQVEELIKKLSFDQANWQQFLAAVPQLEASVD